MKVILLLFLFSISYAEVPTYTVECYFTRTTERSVVYDYILANTTDCVRDCRFMYRISTTMPNMSIAFSSFSTTTAYLKVEFAYLKINENKADAIYNFLKTNVDAWVAQKRIAWIRIKKHQCSHDGRVGTCKPCVETVNYEM